MKFRTETGSIYEVDFEGRRIRRLLGNHPPTERQGEDGTRWASAGTAPIGSTSATRETASTGADTESAGPGRQGTQD